MRENASVIGWLELPWVSPEARLGTPAGCPSNARHPRARFRSSRRSGRRDRVRGLATAPAGCAISAQGRAGDLPRRDNPCDKKSRSRSATLTGLLSACSTPQVAAGMFRMPVWSACGPDGCGGLSRGLHIARRSRTAAASVGGPSVAKTVKSRDERHRSLSYGHSYLVQPRPGRSI